MSFLARWKGLEPLTYWFVGAMDSMQSLDDYITTYEMLFDDETIRELAKSYIYLKVRLLMLPLNRLSLSTVNIQPVKLFITTVAYVLYLLTTRAISIW